MNRNNTYYDRLMTKIMNNKFLVIIIISFTVIVSVWSFLKNTPIMNLCKEKNKDSGFPVKRHIFSFKSGDAEIDNLFISKVLKDGYFYNDTAPTDSIRLYIEDNNGIPDWKDPGGEGFIYSFEDEQIYFRVNGIKHVYKGLNIPKSYSKNRSIVIKNHKENYKTIIAANFISIYDTIEKYVKEELHSK